LLRQVILVFAVKMRLILIALLVLVVARGPAQELTSVFVSPPQPVVAGRQSTLWLYSMNNSSNEVRRAAPATISCRFVSGLQSNGAMLELNTNQGPQEATVAPGAFAKAEYRVTVPLTVRGSATLEITNYNTLVLAVSDSSETTNLVFAPPAPVSKRATNSTPQMGQQLVDYLGNHVSPYEPIYFLLGSYPAAKFQLSLKYRIFAFTNDLNPFSNLYFAYTQTSFWDVISRDPSFYDTSYKPSGFLYYPEVVFRDSEVKLDLQGGAEHESNGRGGADERSLNTIYFQPTLRYQAATNLLFALQPRFWDYASVGDNNPDIANYRGYGDVSGSVTYEKIQLATELTLGKNGDHAGWQFDLRFNLPPYFRFNPAIQIEYFNGYGQTLRQYNEFSSGIRAGLCLWY
jgi:outer membrane phospholipase A